MRRSGKLASKVTAREIRDAAKYIEQRGLAGTITPSLLAKSAKEMGKDFASVLAMVGDILQDDQGQGPSPKARELV